MKFNIKKMISCHLLLFSYLLAGVSCGESNDYFHIQDPIDFADSSFSTKQDIYHTTHSDDFIGDPLRLTIIDSLLFAVDSKTDTIVHAFSTNNKNYVGSLIPRGAGPGELLSIGFIRQGYTPNRFWAYDITRKLWQEGSFDSASREYQFSQLFHFSDTIFDAYEIEDPTWISNHSFICTSLMNYQERYLIFNNEKRLITSVQNPYLTFNERIPRGILCEMVSTLSELKPDKSKLILASRYLNYIEIYNLENNTIWHHLRGPKKSNPIFDENRSFALNTMIKTNKTIKTYLCVKCSNEKIYLLYSGRERSDPSEYTNSNIIYTFNWDGEPLVQYKLDTDITSFDIDEAHSKIYAIKYPENSIISFDLN